MKGKKSEISPKSIFVPELIKLIRYQIGMHDNRERRNYAFKEALRLSCVQQGVIIFSVCVRFSVALRVKQRVMVFMLHHTDVVHFFI